MSTNIQTLFSAQMAEDIKLEPLNVSEVLEKCKLTGNESCFSAFNKKITAKELANNIEFWARVDAQLSTKSYEEGMEKAMDLAVTRLSVCFLNRRSL